MSVDKDAVQAKLDACRQHAGDLYGAAKAVLSAGHPHIAYHLALLSLEELGKATLLFHHHIDAQVVKLNQGTSERRLDQHLEKIFWGLWGSLGSNTLASLTPEDMVQYAEIHRHMHAQRLRGLYVNPDIGHNEVPREAIDASTTNKMLVWLETKLALAQNVRIGELKGEDADLYKWLREAAIDPVKHNFVFSYQSLQKRSELGNPEAWVVWLKEQFDTAEEHRHELTQKELQRQIPDAAAPFTTKWEITLRIFSQSHSIRGKEFKVWNENSEHIQLRALTKNQIHIILKFPSQIHVEKLWEASWGMGHHLLIALNVGTMGLFWWELPIKTERFYDRIFDVESKAELVVQYTPNLTVDWGKRVLTAAELRDTNICFLSLPRFSDKEFPICEHYLNGLKLLAKNDLHLRLEASVFRNFYRALREAIRFYKPECQDLVSGIREWMTHLVTDKKDLEQYITIGERFDVDENPTTPILLSDAVNMKILCDAYLLEVFRAQIRTKIDQLETEEKLKTD